jgi:hypothetical protein
MPNLSLLFSVLTPQKQQFASAASYSWGEVMGYSWNSGDKS